MGIEEKSNEYAENLKKTYEKGSNSGSARYPEIYPYNAPPSSLENPLSSQLKTIARLLSGGSETKIFLARIGGFDTHVSQTESYDATMGSHAALMYHLFSSVKAFQDDLQGLGLEDRVMTVTFSEFGRRPKSNGSYGTDHGTSAPMFVFGKGVNAGVYGKNPGVTEDKLVRGNLDYQHDYRQVFGSLIADWMESPSNNVDALSACRFDDFVKSENDENALPHEKKLPLVEKNQLTGTNKFFSERYALEDCYPNPARNSTTIKFRINHPQQVSLLLLDIHGKLIRKIAEKEFPVGWNELTVNLAGLAEGTYLYSIQAGPLKQSKKLIIQT